MCLSLHRSDKLRAMFLRFMLPVAASSSTTQNRAAMQKLLAAAEHTEEPAMPNAPMLVPHADQTTGGVVFCEAPAQISLSVALGGLGNANASDERGSTRVRLSLKF